MTPHNFFGLRVRFCLVDSRSMSSNVHSGNALLEMKENLEPFHKASVWRYNNLNSAPQSKHYYHDTNNAKLCQVTNALQRAALTRCKRSDVTNTCNGPFGRRPKAYIMSRSLLIWTPQYYTFRRTHQGSQRTFIPSVNNFSNPQGNRRIGQQMATPIRCIDL